MTVLISCDWSEKTISAKIYRTKFTGKIKICLTYLIGTGRITYKRYYSDDSTGIQSVSKKNCQSFFGIFDVGIIRGYTNFFSGQICWRYIKKRLVSKLMLQATFCNATYTRKREQNRVL